MQRMLILAAVAALALAAAPAATAKEVTKAEVCGADGCVAVDDEDGRAALLGAGSSRTPPTAAPYYEVRLRMAHGDEAATFRVAALPGQRAFRAYDGAWYEMEPEMAALLAKVTAGEQPLAAAGLIGAAEPPAPAPKPQAADAGSPLWPEGVLVALALVAAGAFLVRAARGSRRFGRRRVECLQPLRGEREAARLRARGG